MMLTRRDQVKTDFQSQSWKNKDFPLAITRPRKLAALLNLAITPTNSRLHKTVNNVTLHLIFDKLLIKGLNDCAHHNWFTWPSMFPIQPTRHSSLYLYITEVGTKWFTNQLVVFSVTLRGSGRIIWSNCLYTPSHEGFPGLGLINQWVYKSKISNEVLKDSTRLLETNICFAFSEVIACMHHLMKASQALVSSTNGCINWK